MVPRVVPKRLLYSQPMKPENDPTNPNAKPDYDGLGWDSQWTAADWMTWHGAMSAAFGQAEANRRFVAAWQGGGIFEEPPLSARSLDSGFREWARSVGILDQLYYGLGVLAKPVGSANDVLDGVSAVASGVKDTGQSLGGGALKWVLLGVGALAIGIYLLPGSVARAVTKK